MGANGFGNITGATYLYILADPNAINQFTETVILMASNATEADEFGNSVDIPPWRLDCHWCVGKVQSNRGRVRLPNLGQW
jgi:hypothetical protein